MAKRICIIAVARPNFVKVSPLVRAIERHPSAECMLIYAGRADDPTLEDSLFDDLQMPRPQYFLDVDSTSLNEITSRVMATFDRFLDEHPVDVVIVVDDLASTMAAAIVTKKRGIRLALLRYGFSPTKIMLLAEHAFGKSYDKATIKKWLTTFCRRFFAQQFKRSCLPDGPKVGSISLSPRGDWRMPSDASSALWLQECDSID